MNQEYPKTRVLVFTEIMQELLPEGSIGAQTGECRYEYFGASGL
jgi:hypothetical protein